MRFFFVLFLSRVCNCSDYWCTFQIPGYDYCNNAYQTCANNLYYQVFNTGDFIKNFCLNKCPLECQKSFIYQHQSSNTYPDESRLKMLKKNPLLLSKYANESDFKYHLAKNVAKVTIYYDKLAYTVVEEQPTLDWINLLGNLGGHLHLFLGISFMSVVEIIEILIRFTWYTYIRYTS